MFNNVRLKEARLAAGLSREQLAVDMGRGYPTILAWESGLRAPTVTLLGKLADRLDIDPGELVR